MESDASAKIEKSIRLVSNPLANVAEGPMISVYARGLVFNRRRLGPSTRRDA